MSWPVKVFVVVSVLLVVLGLVEADTGDSLQKVVAASATGIVFAIFALVFVLSEKQE